MTNVQRDMARIMTRYERRFGYWPMDSATWLKACAKYGVNNRSYYYIDGNYYIGKGSN